MEAVVEIVGDKKDKGISPEVKERVLGSIGVMHKEVAWKVRKQQQELERIGKRASYRAMSYFQKANAFGAAADKMETVDTSGIDIAYMDLIVDSRVSTNNGKKTLIVETKDITIPYKIQTMSKMINIPVGRFEISIGMDPRSGNIFMQVHNLTSKSSCNRDKNHPHVDSSGNICWGDGQIKVNKFMASNNFVGILDMILYTLSHYNESNPFIRLLRGWSWNMPLLERVCWNCNLPVDKDNIYKIPTVCQCQRYSCCKQLHSEGHEPKCEVGYLPRPTQSSAPQQTNPDLSIWLAETQARLARIMAGQQQQPAEPIPTPIPDVNYMPGNVNQSIRSSTNFDPPIQATSNAWRQFSMLDTQVEMDNAFPAVPCRMMDAWVIGNANTMDIFIHPLLGGVPRFVEFERIRFTFHYPENEPNVILSYEGFNASGDLQIFNTRIAHSAFLRWCERYRTRQVA